MLNPLIIEMYEDITNLEGVKATKDGRNYVQNARLYEEMLKSKAQGKLTDKALGMIILIAQNISNRLHYNDPEDKKDCIQFAIMDCILYWDRFDPEKGNNPFAFFSSVCSNGFAKGWKRLGKQDFPASIVTSLDSNIHSL